MSVAVRNTIIGSAIATTIAVVGLATDWFAFGVSQGQNQLEVARADENRATRIEEEIKAMRAEWQIVRQENDRSDRNAIAIRRLEESVRKIGSTPTSDNVSKAILQVTVLQQRITELESQISNLSAQSSSNGTIDTDAIIATLERQISSLVDAAIAKKIAASGTASGTDRRADAVASIVPDSDTTMESNGLLWEFQKCFLDGRYISCVTQVTNKTRDDKKACLSKAEIVTDTNYHTTEPKIVTVGEEWSYYNNACSNIPPLVSVNSYVKAEIASNVKSEIRLLRYECGVGCQMAIYDKTVSQ